MVQATQLPLDHQLGSVLLGRLAQYECVETDMLTEIIKSTNQPSNTNSIFGGGPPKPAFGTSNTTGTSIFGGNSGGNAFGTTNK